LGNKLDGKGLDTQNGVGKDIQADIKFGSASVCFLVFISGKGGKWLKGGIFFFSICENGGL